MKQVHLFVFVFPETANKLTAQSVAKGDGLWKCKRNTYFNKSNVQAKVNAVFFTAWLDEQRRKYKRWFKIDSSDLRLAVIHAKCIFVFLRSVVKLVWANVTFQHIKSQFKFQRVMTLPTRILCMLTALYMSLEIFPYSIYKTPLNVYWCVKYHTTLIAATDTVEKRECF